MSPEDSTAMPADTSNGDAETPDADLLDDGNEPDTKATDGAQADGEDLLDGDQDTDATQDGEEETQDDGEGEDKPKDDKGEEDAKPEGVPESPEGYELKLPEGFVDEPELSGAVRVFAHEAGLTQEQFQKLIDVYTGHVGGVVNKMLAAREQAHQELKKEWGKDYDSRLKEAKTGVKYLTENVTGFKEFLEETGLSQEPAMFRLAQFVGAQLKESKAAVGGKAPARPQRTKSGRPMFTYKSPKGG